MTRETRIGLMVGLLFIVAFGLVLSELTGTESLPPAPVAAEENVDVYAPTPALEDVSPRGPAVAAVSPRPAPGGLDGGAPAVEASLGRLNADVPRGGTIEAELGPGPAVLAATDRITPAPAPSPAPAPAPAPSPAPAPAPRRRVYKVEANDTLIRIARKVYGPDKEMRYKLIYAANRSKLASESMLSIGQELVIPPLPMEAPRPSPRVVSPSPAGGAPPRPAGYREMAPDQLRRYLDGRPSPRARRRTYVVQRGDSLTEIARKVLRDSSPEAVRKIFNANRDTLESPDLLQVGMTLQIPS